MLHDRPSYLILVRRAVRPGVVQEDPLSRLDCGLGTEVGVRVVGCTDSVFSHSPGLEESLQCLRAELWPIIAGEVFRYSEDGEIFLQCLDQVCC